MFTTLFQQLPAVYQSMLPDLFNQKIPIESYADCQNCNMCQPHDIVPDQRFFSKKTKCCTFKPIVPNYLVGSLLSDTSHRTKIHDYVDNNKKIEPLGYFPSRDEFQHYARINPSLFGIDESAACELLIDGNCSIWKHRNAICSTYFCHYFKGIHGKQFWHDVRDFLQFIESTVAEHCALSLDIPVNYLKNATTNFFINVQESLESPPSSSISKSDIWGKWSGNKSDYFLECLRICMGLTPKDLALLNPNQYHIRLKALETSFNKMTFPALPKTLRFNPECQIINFDQEHAFFYVDRLIKLPAVLSQILPLFDGKTDTQSVIKKGVLMGVSMDTQYVTHLFEQALLVGV